MYTRSVWDLGLNVRHIDFVARQNDADIVIRLQDILTGIGQPIEQFFI